MFGASKKDDEVWEMASSKLSAAVVGILFVVVVAMGVRAMFPGGDVFGQARKVPLPAPVVDEQAGA